MLTLSASALMADALFQRKLGIQSSPESWGEARSGRARTIPVGALPQIEPRTTRYEVRRILKDLHPSTFGIEETFDCGSFIRKAQFGQSAGWWTIRDQGFEHPVLHIVASTDMDPLSQPGM